MQGLIFGSTYLERAPPYKIETKNIGNLSVRTINGERYVPSNE